MFGKLLPKFICYFVERILILTMDLSNSVLFEVFDNPNAHYFEIMQY